MPRATAPRSKLPLCSAIRDTRKMFISRSPSSSRTLVGWPLAIASTDSYASSSSSGAIVSTVCARSHGQPSAARRRSITSTRAFKASRRSDMMGSSLDSFEIQPRRRGQAMLDLENIPWHWTRHEGIGLHILERNEATGDAAVLIFMKAGCGYPPHRHVGEEHVLVLQGAYEDGHATYPTLSFHTHAPGSVHAPRALEGGDCVLFAIAHRGIELVRANRE